jgi:hypothetical protein
MRRREEDLLQCASAVQIGAAEIALLDERNTEAGTRGGDGDAKAGVAATQDQDVVTVLGHALPQFRRHPRLQAEREQGGEHQRDADAGDACLPTEAVEDLAEERGTH